MPNLTVPAGATGLPASYDAGHDQIDAIEPAGSFNKLHVEFLELTASIKAGIEDELEWSAAADRRDDVLMRMMKEPAPGLSDVWKKHDVMESAVFDENLTCPWRDHRYIAAMASIKADLARFAGSGT